MIRRLSLLGIWCVISVLASADAYYTTKGQYDLIDNFGNCQTHNCFPNPTNANNVGGTVSIPQMTSGFDGSVFGVDGAGNIWTLPFMSTATGKSLWAKHPEYGVVKFVTARSVDEIYSLKSDTQCSQGYEANRWTGTAWVVLHHCFDRVNLLSVGVDGTLAGTNPNGSITYTLDPTVSNPTWVTVPGTRVFTQLTVLSQDTAYALSGNVLYSVDLNSGTTAVVSGAPLALDVEATGDQYLILLAKTAGPRGNVYYMDLNAVNPSWINLTTVAGQITGIAGRSSASIFGLNYAVPYHFLATGVRYTTTVNGYFLCNIGQCPTGSIHTATATTGFPHGWFKNSVGTASGIPSGTLNAVSWDVTPNCDPLFGDPNSAECTIERADGNIACSEMGPIYTGSAVSGGPFFGNGTVLVKNLSGRTGYNCTTSPNLKITTCDFNVAPSCSNVTPTWAPSVVTDTTPGMGGWWMHYECLRPYSSAPWWCAEGIRTAWKTPETGPSPNCINPE